jgi:hypothetical protein
MALANDTLLTRRGRPQSGTEFGYLVAAGEIVYRGSLIGLNAAGNAVRLQTIAPIGPAVVAIGVADRQIDNRTSAVVSSEHVTALHGTFGITVPSATVSNIHAPVYATDDSTTTLSSTGSPAPLQVGTLAGLENGQTYVTMQGT